MRSLKARSLRYIAIASVLLAALAVLLYPTDDKRVREAAEALIAAANASPEELARALDTYASPNVSVNLSELPEPLVGRQALIAAVQSARQQEQQPRFRAESVEVSLEGKRARLTADLITTLRPEVPELRRPRHGVALFEKYEGRYRLVSAEVGGERLDQPEARP